MAFTSTDLLKALGTPAFKVPAFNLATSGVTTLFTFPNLGYGTAKHFVVCIVADNFSSTATTATTNFGQSGTATQNDYVSGASLNPANSPVILWPPSTNITFGNGTVIQANTTGAGAGTCTLTIWTEDI
jgi:hypothetical protein